jgi:hypothetical protein
MERPVPPAVWDETSRFTNDSYKELGMPRNDPFESEFVAVQNFSDRALDEIPVVFSVEF